jgi:NAD(P)-dependent dehydrogenase (short-subunit alcohol dehydrogenase family)
MDLTKRESLTATVEQTIDTWGRIDVLVNNAVHTGIGSMSRFEDTTIEMVETKLEGNVVAHVVLIKAVLPQMLERGEGRVINVTSPAAVIDPPAPVGEGGWGAAYAMSKGAFHRLARILAYEYPALSFFNIEPGFVITERMKLNAKRLGLDGHYRGSPPSVPASVIAWLAEAPEAVELSGQTIAAPHFARTRRLHPPWTRR